MKQQLESIDAKLNVKWKNGKTAYQNALHTTTPNFPPHKRILDLIEQKKKIQKAVEKSASIGNKALGESIAKAALNLGIINKLTQQTLDNLLKEETLYALQEYLLEDNEKFSLEENSKNGLESGDTKISLDDNTVSILDKYDQEELKSISLIIIGKASKTGTKEINTKIALERAINMQQELLNKYPSLNSDNIQIKIALQPDNNTEDLSLWQRVDIKIKSTNKTYVEGYEKNNPLS